MNIMVVEDEVELAGLVRDYLIQAGHEVTVYHHGGEALAAAKRQPPDLMVLDLMLPGMDGLVVCREVRQTTSPSIPGNGRPWGYYFVF